MVCLRYIDYTNICCSIPIQFICHSYFRIKHYATQSDANWSICIRLCVCVCVCFSSLSIHGLVHLLYLTTAYTKVHNPKSRWEFLLLLKNVIAAKRNVLWENWTELTPKLSTAQRHYLREPLDYAECDSITHSIQMHHNVVIFNYSNRKRYSSGIFRNYIEIQFSFTDEIIFRIQNEVHANML